MPTVQEVLALALDCHRSGRLVEAESLYNDILRSQPDVADARHLLGVLLVQTNRPLDGIRLIEGAIALNGANADYHLNLAQARRQAGDRGGAIAAYDRAISLNPSHVGARLSRAQLLEEMGELDGAADAYRATVTLPGDIFDAWCGLGRIAMARSQWAEAVAAFEAASRLRGHEALPFSNLGLCHEALGQMDVAEAAYRSALDADLDMVAALVNLGDLLRRRGGRPEEASALLDRALDRQPRLYEAGASRGELYLSAGDVEKAADMARGLIAIAPNRAEAYGLLARALRAQGQTGDALKVSRRQLELDPGDDTTRFNIAFCLLRLGDYRQGFPLYRRRWSLTPLPRRHLSIPEWQGEALDGKTLLVWDEQGVGDTLMAARFLPLLKRRAGRLLFESPHSLAMLWPDQDMGEVLLRGEPLPVAPDYQIAMMDVPAVLEVTPDTIPWNGPYVQASPERRRPWAERLAPLPGRKIALVWAGNPEFPQDAWRSPGLAPLLPLIQESRDTFVSIQLGAGRRYLEELTPPANLVDLGPDIRDWADTAAILDTVDLLITSCTAPAHLAGALGRPVWTMLCADPDWRWLDGQDTSPWYPTMRLFRQKRLYDWSDVVAAMAAALAG